MLLLLFIQEQRPNDLNQLLNYLTSNGNPVFYSLAIVIIIFLIFFSYFKRKVLPDETRIVETSRRIQSLYANEYLKYINLDPDPVIRFTETGYVIAYNNAAKKVFPEITYLTSSIHQLFPGIKETTKELAIAGKTTHFSINNDDIHLFGRLIVNKEFNGMVAYLHDSTAYFRYEKEYLQIKEDMKNLRIHLFNKIESEKRRIAIELHDGIGQVFSAAKLQVNRLEESFDKKTVEDVYKKSTDLLTDGIQELRNITYELRPKILEELGLAAAIETLIDRVSFKGLFEGTLKASGDFKNIDRGIELTVYRLAQEAINNIVKHSHAKYFSIQLIKTENIIRLLTMDNGFGFNTKTVFENANRQRGMGLLNMIERSETFGGTCEFISEPDKGTKVIIELPLENKHDTR